MMQQELYEGKAKFKTRQAFYNPRSKLVRDLGVLAAKVYGNSNNSLRVLDGFAGCGVRSLRYWLESKADFLWVNEGNPDLRLVLEANLLREIPKSNYRVTYLDANRVFFDCYNRRDYYDLIDVDCFGTAAPYLSTMIWATKIGGLMYLTCTDGRSLTGRLPENSLKAYGSYARSHPAIQEQALRLLIGSVQQQASNKGLGVEQIFSLWFNATYRVMLRLVARPQLTSENYGFLGFCHHCGNYKTVSWRKLSQAICEFDNQPLTLTGAMWLGQLHDVSFLHKMQEIARQWQWDKVVRLLSVMMGEADFPPYFYTLREIGSRGKLDIPKRSHLIEALQNAGYRATITHINPEAIKTDADIHTCIDVAQKLNGNSQ
ncbi:MAG: tRNA (guanine-N1)-methyltransferase [Xenococcaceae cyanobacterium MO_167.B27]|nr:tRNA (guanine-N1)-methyltransferase [Xenococcaceae cyanobacterium MO_167.B27]